MRKITKEAADAFYWAAHFRKGNTEVEQTGDGPVMTLHGNAIARRVFRDGQEFVEVSLAGWPTVTTRERLNGLPGVRVYQHGGKQYLNGVQWDGNWRRV